MIFIPSNKLIKNEAANKKTNEKEKETMRLITMAFAY